jgi:hypothetical protein
MESKSYIYIILPFSIPKIIRLNILLILQNTIERQK